MWVWIAIGVGGFVLLSAVTALLLARVLGTIADQISTLEPEDWATRPPTRSTEQPEQDESDDRVRTATARRR